MKHVLVARVENKPGVLNRVASLFRRRNFNIISLTVGETEDPAVSRMTIVVDASKTDASMVQRNLLKLINVIDVEDLTHRPARPMPICCAWRKPFRPRSPIFRPTA